MERLCPLTPTVLARVGRPCIALPIILHPKVMKLLLKSCTQEALNAANVKGWTPLHVAVFPKTHIKDLVDWEWTDEYQKDLREWYMGTDRWSSLQEEMLGCKEALDNLHLDIVLQLLQAGADVEAVTAQGWSLLRCVAATWEVPIWPARYQAAEPHQAHVQSTFQAYMRELEFRIDHTVEEGINYNNYRHYGDGPPLYIDEGRCPEGRHQQVLNLFDFRQEYRFQGHWQGSRFRDLERSKHVLADDSMEVALMAELLHCGADADHANELGWTALHYATAGNCIRATQLLVSAGADVNAQTNPQGWTALHYATAAHSTEATQLLASAGADVNAQDSKGQTALFYAAQAKQLDSVDVLLSLGAHPTVTDTTGQLPSVPFDTAQVQKAASALDSQLQERLRLTNARISKAPEPVDPSAQNQRTVPISLRTGWPLEALQVMQSMDELQAQMLQKDQQHKDAMQALEAEFMQMMIQLQERLQSLEV